MIITVNRDYSVRFQVPLNNIKQFIFIIEKCFIFLEFHTEILNIIYMSFSFKGLNHLCILLLFLFFHWDIPSLTSSRKHSTEQTCKSREQGVLKQIISINLFFSICMSNSFHLGTSNNFILAFTTLFLFCVSM
jgi:hypothetical protein